MPIQVNIIDENRGIEFVLSGVAYGSDIINAHRKFHSREANAVLKYKVIDKSRVTDNRISIEEVKTIAELDKELLKQNPEMVVIFVSARDQEISTAQQWTALLRDYYERLHFFNSRQEADEWLKENY
jgi:hypothetical protein